ncbi:putative metallopeptidase [Burkholderia vietnamiensis]|uniref:putative metallopeptidase n=1 Tax=Burkholderia vietnamiensis TaxID=60552 RepID=UPI001594CA8F|nr:putative metallopeptidase [Burkholderia vietnamiensis]
MPRPKRTDVAPVAHAPRPAPPDILFDDSNWIRRIVPADGVAEWVNETFLRDGAPLHNPDHEHLIGADVAYLWAAVENVRQMRRVVGQCEEVTIRAGGWQRARQEQQFLEWFGRVPAFLITLDAHYARECNDLQWCALVEHELYHIGQRTDEFGAPAFTKDGMPKLGIRGHDVEEFVGIVRRYGVAGGAGDTAKLVDAARRAPEVGHVDIARACGTCILRAA